MAQATTHAIDKGAVRAPGSSVLLYLLANEKFSELMRRVAQRAMLSPPAAAPKSPTDPVRELLQAAEIYRAGGWNVLADSTAEQAFDVAMAMHGTWAVN